MADDQPPPLEQNDLEDDDDIFADKLNTVPKPMSGSMTNVDASEDLFASASDDIDLNDDSTPTFITKPTLELNTDSEVVQTNGHSPKLDLFAERDLESPTVPAFSPRTDSSPPAIKAEPLIKSPSPTVTASGDPFGAPADMRAPANQPATPPLSSTQAKPEIQLPTYKDYEFTLTIPQYEKRGDGLRSAYYVYKVVFKPVNIQVYKQNQYEVWRRFSDFLGLYDKLAAKHLVKGVIIPPPPEKSVVGNARTKMSNDESTPTDFLERRRLQLERYLQRTAQHPTLLTDCDFVDFVTLGVDLPKSSNTSAFSVAGINRLVNKVGDALNKMAVASNDSDQWFEDKMLLVETIHDHVAKLIGSLDATVHYRREMSSAITQLCGALSMLATCEENTSLSRALSQLAETQEKIALCQSEQADKDLYLMSESWRDQLHMLEAVKNSFYERQKLYQAWMSAQVTLTKKRENKTRLELAGKSDKVPIAKAEVQEQERRVQMIEEEFNRLSQILKVEVERWDQKRVAELKENLIKYVEALTLTQQQLIKYWEAYVPEAKAILEGNR